MFMHQLNATFLLRVVVVSRGFSLVRFILIFTLDVEGVLEIELSKFLVLSLNHVVCIASVASLVADSNESI